MSLRTGVQNTVVMVFGAWVLIAICLQTWGVFSRNIMGWSTAWLDDIQRLNFIWLIWILAAVAYGTRGLIRLDLLQTALTKRPRAYHSVSLAITAFEFVFSASLLVLGTRILSTHINSGELTVAISLPVWLLTLGFVLGCLLLMIFSLRNAVRETRQLVTNAPVHHEGEIAMDVEDAVEPEAELDATTREDTEHGPR